MIRPVIFYRNLGFVTLGILDKLCGFLMLLPSNKPCPKKHGGKQRFAVFVLRRCSGWVSAGLSWHGTRGLRIQTWEFQETEDRTLNSFLLPGSLGHCGPCFNVRFLPSAREFKPLWALLQRPEFLSSAREFRPAWALLQGQMFLSSARTTCFKTAYS